MSLFSRPDEILLLRDLLNPQDAKNDSDTDEDERVPAAQMITPANLGPDKKVTKPKAVIENKLPEKKKPQNVEEWQKMQEEEDAEALETRKCPEYTMTYRQAVGTEDVFLQMGNRTSGSASCEDLVLEIMLPEETIPADKMNLSITSDQVDLATPVYRLKLPLQHPVNVDRCNAKYDATLHKMILTLRLKREFDYVNF